MTPLRWLLSPDHDAAFSKLCPWIASLAPKACTQRGTPVAIPSDRAEDVVAVATLKLFENGHRIAERILARNPTLDPDSEEATRIVRRYICVMLGHSWLSIQRQEARFVPLGPEIPPTLTPTIDAPEPKTEHLMAHAQAALAKATAAAVQARNVDVEVFSRSIAELWALARREVTVWALADAARTAEPGTPRKTMRDRILRNHSRARAYLRDAARSLDPAQAELVRGLLDAVLTRRRAPRRAEAQSRPLPAENNNAS